ncbi:molybdopterin synthase catalytic subunit-like [Rhagoletis pomonella]|uniref:molybdopterin synthase catalytic subunit-like n=1 Tax=Rhagoletis pomonella TaxID=28610 RepID=UPI00177E456B|nr:molybdopterin synthase catalytic subunit-like [Rhagoletis pomonella]XP_036328716.1 molybdopterin synthase catalytic subunit-like [Rhagoletis pomonella]XP_036328717.1 molybdopterin synthase catalytic subunit-like [Rhagoletis pomonella]
MSNFLVITPEPLLIGAISNLVLHEKCSALSLFVETTPNNLEQKLIPSVERETNESIAKKELKCICDEIRSRWKGVMNIAIYKRIGLIAPKEAKVVIAIASPFQQCSLEALGYAIEQLKKAVLTSERGLHFNENRDYKQDEECQRVCEDSERFCFSKSKIHAETPVSTDLVQITANGNEIRNRIARFITIKREEIDQNNIVDYINIDKLNKNEEDCTCARVNSTVVKQERSKCHLKVFRVKNTTGPQTRPNYLRALDKLMTYDPSMKLNLTEGEKIGVHTKLPTSAHNRLEAIEQHLFRSSNHDLPISRRLKEIEDRILRLESISPEYWHFIVDANNSPKTSKQNSTSDKVITKTNYGCDPSSHKVYTVNELDSLMQQIQTCKDMEIN